MNDIIIRKLMYYIFIYKDWCFILAFDQLFQNLTDKERLS